MLFYFQSASALGLVESGFLSGTMVLRVNSFGAVLNLYNVYTRGSLYAGAFNVCFRKMLSAWLYQFDAAHAFKVV